MVSGCCTTDKACDDGNACTKDQCAANQCLHASLANCCVTAKDCDDGDSCTLDVCNPKGACQSVVKKGCCSSDKMCDDGNACTVNRCNLNTRQCVTQSIKGCCSSDAQCDDGNPCTKNACDRNVCITAKIPGCCDVAEDCNDANACTLDSCLFGKCQNAQSKLCCSTNLDCGKIAYCDAGACKPFVQAGQVCTQDAACITGDCLTGCSTPLCAPGAEPFAKYLWTFETLADFTADPATTTTIAQSTPGSMNSPAALTLSGDGQTAILHTATDFRVLAMVTGSLDQPKLDPGAIVTLEALTNTLEAAKGIIEVQLYGSDGWVIVRRDVPNGTGTTSLLELGWSRHTFVAVKAGTYGPDVPKPTSPTVRVAISGPKTLTIDNLRVTIPARLPKACCETDLVCGDAAYCADGACVPK